MIIIWHIFRSKYCWHVLVWWDGRCCNESRRCTVQLPVIQKLSPLLKKKTPKTMGTVPWYLCSTFYQKWPLPRLDVGSNLRSFSDLMDVGDSPHRGGWRWSNEAAEQKSRVGDLAKQVCNHEKLRWKYMELPTQKGLIWKMTFLFKVLIFRFYVSCVRFFCGAARG